MKECIVKVRVSQGDKVDWERTAQGLGLSVSDWLRGLARGSESVVSRKLAEAEQTIEALREKIAHLEESRPAIRHLGTRVPTCPPSVDPYVWQRWCARCKRIGVPTCAACQKLAVVLLMLLAGEARAQPGYRLYAIGNCCPSRERLLKPIPEMPFYVIPYPVKTSQKAHSEPSIPGIKGKDDERSGSWNGGPWKSGQSDNRSGRPRAPAIVTGVWIGVK